MPFEIKKEGFETVEQAVAYLTNEITKEIRRLEGVETEAEAEKQRILANRDQVLTEKKDLQTKLQQAETDLATAQKTKSDLTDAEKRFADTRAELEKDFTARIQKIEDERKAEKDEAAAAKLKAAVLGELSKPEHGLINPDHFWKLHGDRLTQDENGELYVDLGEFKRQNAKQYIEDVAQRPSEQHLFKPKGGRGNDSPGAGNKPQSTATNPWKKENFNLTEQGRILTSNPALATRLKAEAGVK